MVEGAEVVGLVVQYHDGEDSERAPAIERADVGGGEAVQLRRFHASGDGAVNVRIAGSCIVREMEEVAGCQR